MVGNVTDASGASIPAANVKITLTTTNDTRTVATDGSVFNTEFGRTPFAQSAAGTLGKGRDHNQKRSASGWPEPVSSPGLPTARPTNLAVGHDEPVRCTISTPRSCTCWASTTSD